MPAPTLDAPQPCREEPREDTRAIAEVGLGGLTDRGREQHPRARQVGRLDGRLHRRRECPIDEAQRPLQTPVAGVEDPHDPAWQDILRVGAGLADDLLAPFLVIARAAQDGLPCPDDDELARVYGTSSPGRLRRLIEHYERNGLIVVRTDFGGRRSVTIPELGLSTAPLEA